MKLLIAAGGTGGHLFPGIAVAETLKKWDSKNQISFIGSERGLESDILKREGWTHRPLVVGRIKGEGMKAKVKTLMRLPLALGQALNELAVAAPEVVLGIGGYSSGPVILAAFLKRIPRAILEPNSIPGFTNRILGHFANRVFLAFPETARFFAKRKVRITGTPVRQKLMEVGAKKAQVATAAERPFTLLVLGGSQGATSINKAVVDLLPHLESALEFKGRSFQILHQTGSKDIGWVQEAYRTSPTSKVQATASAFIEDMAAVYASADLVISRAGASTIAELIETRSPAILVPYPFAADDHQRCNAQSVVRAGGAEMILNDELEKEGVFPPLLAQRVLHYEAHREELRMMQKGLETLRRVPAAEAVSQECLERYGT